MKRWSKLLLTAAVILMVLTIGMGMVQAKSYSIPEVYIEAEILEDGRVRIQEHRTFAFEGSFSWLEQWIFIKGDSRFDNFSLLEGSTRYRREDSGEPGTYQVDYHRDKTVVRWYYQARDQRKTFTISYDAHQVIMVHEDTVDFQYMFIGDDWEVPTEKATVVVTLPEAVPEEDIRAWGHGPLHGELDIEGNTVIYRINNLPRGEFLEGRILFPHEYLPAAAQEYRTGKENLESILQEEAALAERANRQRLRDILDWGLAAVVFLAALGGIFYFWWKFGKEYQPEFDGDYYRELPGDYSPAEMGVLYRFGTINPEDLTATIMDLARRGYLKIEEGEEKKTGLFKKGMDYRLTLVEGKSQESLAPHEREMLDFMFISIALGGRTLNFSDIENYARLNPSKFQRFYTGWQSMIRLYSDKYGFFDTGTQKARSVEFVVGGFLVITGMVLIFIEFMVTGFAMMFGGVLMLVAAAMLRRRSQEGVTQFAKWRAFRKFLMHFSQMDKAEIPSLLIWEHYLVYAISLGVAKEVIEQLNIVFPNLQEGNYRFGYGWYYMHTGRMASGMPLANFDGMTNRLQQSFKTAANYRLASTSGRGGGGFSGGGGGGFGGGGGRAG